MANEPLQYGRYYHIYNRGNNANVAALEAEIDQHMYQLYGLSAAEIAIVEGAANE